MKQPTALKAEMKITHYFSVLISPEVFNLGLLLSILF